MSGRLLITSAFMVLTAVPAFADGILLVRNTKEMAAFDLRPDTK